MSMTYGFRLHLSSPKRRYHWKREFHFPTNEEANTALNQWLKDPRVMEFQALMTVSGDTALPTQTPVATFTIQTGETNVTATLIGGIDAESIRPRQQPD